MQSFFHSDTLHDVPKEIVVTEYKKDTASILIGNNIKPLQRSMFHWVSN